MAKKKSTRRQARRAAQQRRNRITMGIVIGVALAFVAGLYAFSQREGVQATDRALRDPIMGNPDAPVTIIEYGAYGCEACRQWHEFGVVETILNEFPGQVRFIYRDMPIIFPSYSQNAAEVAECAFDQGNDAYWQMHALIFEQGQLGQTRQDEFVEMGAQIGLDMPTLRACVDSNIHENTVRYDLARGQELGIAATPTWFVNDQRVFNASPTVLRNAIQRELARRDG